MTKIVNILIGDDEFQDFITEMFFKNDYLPKLQIQTPGYQFNVTYETEARAVIDQVRTGKYDIVVTDLDYSGGGSGKEGYEVIDVVAKLNPRPFTILCSSCDRHKEIEEKTKGKIDARAGGSGKGHKFGDLVEILAKHFSK